MMKLQGLGEAIKCLSQCWLRQFWVATYCFMRSSRFFILSGEKAALRKPIGAR
jgi:hypothetical protein